ncbi:MAG: alanine--tRNA ligase [Ginsengibacter sp.]
MMKSAEIRQHFLDFFKEKLHTVVPSAPIVIKNDPTLLFTNAGMNQFKEYFLGNKEVPFSRAADTQKCLRVSGKHNDLEEVGVDTYHHTMFEMLGNWSFGNAKVPPPPYFKEEAIAWSWELLTERYKIPKENLYVTVFEGDKGDRLPADDESLNFWKKWVAEDHIIYGNKKDNFWEMGDTGPCGPCTEIHVDCRSEEEKKTIAGKDLVNNDHPQVIEIWNNVFIQYNRKKDGSLDLLPANHVDTGMGFERLVRILQNKQSNYDTDVFSGTIEKIEFLSGKKYTHSDSKEDISFRVIADHIRAIAFPITDGQLPSNTGAGYVIRRILRRAVRYYFSYLDVKEPLIYKLVPLIAEQFKNVFPELLQQQDFVAKVIHEEENNFLKTLDSGLKKLDILLQEKKNIDGKTAFELYDTFGFPSDLTQLIAVENHLEMDQDGFDIEMTKQKERSRAAAVVDTEDWVIVNENGSPEFIGYHHTESKSKLLKYRKTKSQGKEVYHVVLDKTPFYAESGGQIGDTGFLIFDGEKIPVINTKKQDDLIIHFLEKMPAYITGNVKAQIDTERRKLTMAHHSATHLMHAALRKVLGTHVAQKGSWVTPDNLRFDFSHFTKVTDEEIAKAEAIVNEKILENIPVVIKEMKKEEAMASGAMALFGEKYGDMVRVVTMDPDYSIELCGGTHIANTGDLGFFKIVHETAVGAGVRRVEALSGKSAQDYITSELSTLNTIKQSFKNPKDISKAVSNLQLENTDLKKQLEKMEAKQIGTIKDSLLQKTTTINGVNFIGEKVDVSSLDALKKLSLLLKNELIDFVVILTAEAEGKSFVSIIMDEKIADARNWEAPKLIKEDVAPLIKGGGGGQKYFATAGGQDTSKLQEVIDKMRSRI